MVSIDLMLGQEDIPHGYFLIHTIYAQPEVSMTAFWRYKRGVAICPLSLCALLSPIKQYTTTGRESVLSLLGIFCTYLLDFPLTHAVCYSSRVPPLIFWFSRTHFCAFVPVALKDEEEILFKCILIAQRIPPSLTKQLIS